MGLASEADELRRALRHEEARAMFERALTLEREAAGLVTREPSFSILHRSAAWLALDAEQPREAERLAAVALASRNVSDGMANQLRAVMEEARLRLHTPLPPPTAVSSITLHMEGPQVGFGGANPADVEPRVRALTNVLVRTAERHAGQTFRRRGATSGQVAKQLQPRVAYAAGSVVAQVTLGGGDQPTLWDENANLVREVQRCLQAYAAKGPSALRALILDDVYRENFASLATQIAPDGVRVTSVDVLGATASGRLPVVRLRERHASASAKQATGEESRDFVGEFRAADETGAKNTIRVITDEGATLTFEVNEAVMEDIVRPFYGQRVQVRGRKKGAGNRWVLLGQPELAADDAPPGAPVDEG